MIVKLNFYNKMIEFNSEVKQDPIFMDCNGQGMKGLLRQKIFEDDYIIKKFL